VRSLAGAASVLVALGLLVWAAHASGQDSGMGRLVAVPGGVDVVAFAGTERLFATRGALMRVAPDGRAVPVARLRGTAIQLVASPSAVAVIEQRGAARRLLAGPPAGPLRTIARCRGRRAEIPYSPLAVAGSAVAEALSCKPGVFEGAASYRVHEGGAVRTAPVARGARVIALAGAPGLLAVATETSSRHSPLRVEVLDTRTGAVRYAVGGVPEMFLTEPLAVREDGLVVFCGDGVRLAWASPAAPTAHAIGRVECPYEVFLAGDSLAYIDARTDAMRVADLGGRGRTLVRPSGDTPLDWDGTRALVRGLGCGEDFLGEIGLLTRPYRGPACHVRIVRVARAPGRRAVRVTVACRQGCRGDVALLLGYAGEYDEARLGVRRPGRRIVRIPLRTRARRLLGRYRSVPFHATVNYVNPADGAGSQPIVERSGVLAGDGRRRFRPPPRPPDETRR
jgi:hypothetical protein